MNNAMSELYATGNMLFPTRILNINKIPTITHTDGHQYKVLNIAKLPNDTDLSQYGLSVKNKADLRFIFHNGDFETMQSLQKPFNESIICTTMISPDKKATYGGKGVGMMLDTVNSNVINSSPYNQSSGCGRDFSSFVKMASDKHSYRPMQREVFIKTLQKKYNLSENDYTQIYRQMIDKQYPGQIHDVKLADGTVIKSDDLKAAYKSVEEMIMANTSRYHNEINLYNPQLKGAILIGNSLEEIPPETLKFIREHNLPIFIMGKYNYLF